MLALEPRLAPSPVIRTLTPLLAVILTVLAGGIMFALMGKDPLATIQVIFLDPLFNEMVASYTRPQILVKAAPLVMIALGLSYGFRANIWNIGAEGQYVIGAVAGASVGLALYPLEAFWLLPLMVLAGIAGGIAWAMIPAVLKIYFRTNEILVSLMLVYVASNLLSGLVTGVLRSPAGFNFPESRSFHALASTHNKELIVGTGMHFGVFFMIALVAACYWLLKRHIFAFQVTLSGQAPRAARFAGIRPGLMVALCLGVSGGLAGMAGILEVTGPAGKLTTTFPVGYGFTAIIVAFLGRLHPVGILLAGLLLAITYIGGELAQFMIGLPAASIMVFQGMLLFFLLAADILINFRVRWRGMARAARPHPGESPVS